MKQFALFISAIAIGLIFIPACTDPTEIGADLLEGDRAEVGFTDTLAVIAMTEKTDSILTYFPVFSASEAFQSYPVGDMDDPIFGKSKAQIYAQVSLSQLLPDLEAAAKIDSIVLVLPYDSSSVYGFLNQDYGLSVHRLTEDMDEDISYYSNDSFQSDPTPLGSVQFRPKLDSVTIYDYPTTGRDTLKVPPQLRIPLPISFAQELVRLDTAFYRSDSAFISYFKGIHIKPTIVTNGMLSFRLLDSRAGIFLYYERADTLKRQFKFEFNPFRARSVQIEHDYKGELVERYVNSTQLGDSLVFVQGLSGLTTKLEIPHIKNLKNLVINKAELEVRVADLPGDNLGVFKPVPQLLLLAPDNDGDLVTIDDIAILLPQGLTILRQAYGGVPAAGKPGEPMVYKMNISTHVQGMIDGLRENVLYLTVFNRNQNASRVPLYGAKHPQYSIKLKVAFSRLPNPG